MSEAQKLVKWARPKAKQVDAVFDPNLHEITKMSCGSDAPMSLEFRAKTPAKPSELKALLPELAKRKRRQTGQERVVELANTFGVPIDELLHMALDALLERAAERLKR